MKMVFGKLVDDSALPHILCPSCRKKFPAEAIYRPSMGMYRHIKECKRLKSDCMRVVRTYTTVLPGAMKGNGKGRHKGSNRRN